MPREQVVTATFQTEPTVGSWTQDAGEPSTEAGDLSGALPKSPGTGPGPGSSDETWHRVSDPAPRLGTANPERESATTGVEAGHPRGVKLWVQSRFAT